MEITGQNWEDLSELLFDMDFLSMIRERLVSQQRPINCSRRVLSGLRSGVEKHSIESDVRELAQ
jgi:hypothetical protein